MHWAGSLNDFRVVVRGALYNINNYNNNNDLRTVWCI